VSGSGWHPEESVTFGLRELPAEHEVRTFTIQADGNGNIDNAPLFLVEEHHLGITFYLTARGAASQAQTTFTDAITTTCNTVAGVTTITVSGGETGATGPRLLGGQRRPATAVERHRRRQQQCEPRR
jgi:hypothetical protein